jgi:DNA-binding response OmpR family regulator
MTKSGSAGSWSGSCIAPALRVWGLPPGTASDVVDVCVGRLRARLGTDVITTVHGEGYRVGPG